MFDQAMRTLFTRVLPLPPDGDPNAYLNIHWAYPRKGAAPGERPLISGRAHKTVDELISTVNWIGSSATTQAVYYCLSSQRMAEMRQTSNGYPYLKAVRSQANACEIKCLFIDIDVKPDSYKTSAHAAGALAAFVRDAGLPLPSIVVASGTGGFHVYWTFTAPLTVQRWQPLADALAEATRRNLLMCDTACTVDAARIARVPGTLNKKADPPVYVKLMPHQGPDVTYDQMASALRPYMRSNVVQMHSAPQITGGVNDDLSAGLARQSRPVVLSSIAPQCGFINEALQTGGAGFSYPLWHLTTLIATFAEDGANLAHQMASQHKGYTFADTQDLYDRKVLEKTTKNLGWPSCSSIQNAGCSHCAVCPHLAKGKSPLHWGMTATMPFGAEADLPQSYMRESDGTIVVARTDKEGDTTLVKVCPYPIKAGWVQRNPWVLHFTTVVSSGSEVEVSVGLPEVSGGVNDMAKKLAAQGMTIGSTDAPRLKEFLVAWINKLQSAKERVVNSAPYGWVYREGNVDAFAYGGTVFSAAGERPSAHPDPVIGRDYSPTGSLDKWKTAAKLITDQRRFDLDTILAVAFASPLMRFTGERGLLVSAYSPETGIGKSTAIKVSQAVWGSPKEGVQTLNDTENAITQKMNQLKVLPIYWDELALSASNRKNMDFLEFIFRIAQGKNKSRLNADSSMKQSGSWDTIVLAAGNYSLAETADRSSKTTTAGIARILEFRVRPASHRTMPVASASRIVAALDNNFGEAGKIYAEFLGKNAASVEKQVHDMHRKIEAQIGMSGGTNERLWVAGITAIVMGAVYANHLSLTNFDVNALLMFLHDTLKVMRDRRQDSTANMTSPSALTTILVDYIKAHQSKNVLLTDRVYVATSGGRPPRDSIAILNDITRLERAAIQIGRSDGIVQISVNHFFDWLHRQGYNSSIVADSLKQHLAMEDCRRATIGAGTALPLPMAERCYRLNLSGMGIIDDYTTTTTTTAPAPTTP